MGKGGDVVFRPVCQNAVDDAALDRLDLGHQLLTCFGHHDDDAAGIGLRGFTAQGAARHHLADDAAGARGIDTHHLGNGADRHLAVRLGPPDAVKDIEMGDFKARGNIADRKASKHPPPDHRPPPPHRAADHGAVALRVAAFGLMLQFRLCVIHGSS